MRMGRIGHMVQIRRLGVMIGAAVCITGTALSAQSTLETSRAVYVERSTNAADGRLQRALEPAGNLRSGDRVVLMVEWRTAGNARGLTVASSVPRSLAFQRSSEDLTEISIDGGQNWGHLGQMRIAGAQGTRLVSPEDVTHLRWRVPANQIANGQNRITYSAIVR